MEHIVYFLAGMFAGAAIGAIAIGLLGSRVRYMVADDHGHSMEVPQEAYESLLYGVRNDLR